jgi:hypothetical protein
MTPRTPQCEVFWSLLSNSKHSGVPEDSKSPTLGVGVSSSHFTQSGVATLTVKRIVILILLIIKLDSKGLEGNIEDMDKKIVHYLMLLIRLWHSKSEIIMY